MVVTTAGKRWRARKMAARRSSGITQGLWGRDLAYYFESISVGDGDSQPTRSDTDLSGAAKSNRSLLEADSSIVEQDGTLVMSVTFPTTEANHVWHEVGLWISNGTTRILYLHELRTNPAPAKTTAHTRTAVISIDL